MALDIFIGVLHDPPVLPAIAAIVFAVHGRHHLVLAPGRSTPVSGVPHRAPAVEQYDASSL